MVSERTKNIGIGSVLTFVTSLGTATPGFGLILGPMFTFGGGLTGGSVGGFLEGGGAADGAKVGLLVALVGGVTFSVVAVTGGTLFDALIATSDGSGASVGSWLVIAAVGFVSGLVFTFMGGLVGGNVAGAIRGD